MTKPAENLRVLEGGADGAGRAPSDPPPDPLIGRTIDGRYLIEGVLGEGGMGLVYRATHAVLNKPLAVKVLRPDVSKDEEIITRFRQEAQSASAIGNEHIINISDFGTLSDGSTYFVMEFLDGVDLTTAIEQKTPTMTTGRAVHVARQLCHALGAAHDAGIVHRDLKPDNIYLIRRGQDHDFVKVLDFGIAKVGSGTRRLTKAGQVFGTPHYMSPEQCGGQGIDHRTDIYALGVILYEMVTGQVPFDADNLMGVLTKHMYEMPVPPNSVSEISVDCPPALEAIILKALQKDPADRYASMAELAEDLGSTLHWRYSHRRDRCDHARRSHRSDRADDGVGTDRCDSASLESSSAPGAGRSGASRGRNRGHAFYPEQSESTPRARGRRRPESGGCRAGGCARIRTGNVRDR